MPIRSPRAMAAATTAALCLAGAIALAGDTRAPECEALDNSLLAVPDWYAARCLDGNAVTDHSRYTERADLFPGDPVYYKTLYPAPIGFAYGPLPFPPQLVSRNAQPIFAMTVGSSRQLYAIDNSTRQVGRPDVGIGAFNPIATLNPDPGPAFTISGLTFDPATGGAYIVASDGAPSGSRLYRLDVNTGALTLVGTITNAPFVADIAFGPQGRLYGHDIGSDTLILIDKVTAARTVIGPTGLAANFAQGMMYDSTGATLYGCAFVTQPAQQGQLVQFNLSTGAATAVAGPVPDEMECAIGNNEGPCIAPPFAGIRRAISPGTSPCAVDLAWNAAIICPNANVKYNVHRSTTPGVPPSAATLLRSCLTTVAYTDTDVVGGTRYYYRVVAEDVNTGGGNGACNGGITSGGDVELSSAPVGPLTRVTDDVENGGGNWDTSGGTGSNPWTIVTTQPHSPTHAWSVADPPASSDQRLRMVTPMTVPAGGGELDFWHWYSTENSVDGHVLEYSLDGGTTWSDILAGQGTVPGNLTRFVEEGYDALIRPGTQSPLAGRQAWSGALGYRHVRVDLGDFAGRDVTVRFRFASDGAGGGTGVWIDDISFTPAAGSCVTVPSQTAAPVGLAVDAAGNGVYQPNETVVVAPSWRNTGTGAFTLTGALTGHSGPAGPTYAIPDGAASYGTIPVGNSASCGSNCYSVANVTTARPVTHWDSTALETVTPSGATKTWTLHVGDSFTDVPPSSGFYRFVETILHKGVTGGCTGTAYCPTGATTRDQLAVFVLAAKEPAGYAPTPCGATPMFTDVPVSSPFCRWIEELARRGVVGGCGPGTFCPSGRASREQMAVIVLRALLSTLDPPACTTPMFIDVPASSPYCRWIEELVRRGVVSGCGAGLYCPTANVTREQMAVFLTLTFGLTLYGL